MVSPNTTASGTACPYTRDPALQGLHWSERAIFRVLPPTKTVIAAPAPSCANFYIAQLWTLDTGGLHSGIFLATSYIGYLPRQARKWEKHSTTAAAAAARVALVEGQQGVGSNSTVVHAKDQFLHAACNSLNPKAIKRKQHPMQEPALARCRETSSS